LSVTRSAEIHTEGEELGRKDGDKADIGGCRRQLGLRELI
jgi:hypothetical protein